MKPLANLAKVSMSLALALTLTAGASAQMSCYNPPHPDPEDPTHTCMPESGGGLPGAPEPISLSLLGLGALGLGYSATRRKRREGLLEEGEEIS